LIGGLSSGGHDANAGSCLGVFATILMLLVWAVTMVALMLVLVPLKIRASLTQDFAKSFDLGFVKRFLALTWKEIVVSSLFVMLTGLLFFCLGMIAFCVGVYCAIVLVYFTWTHLHKQLYALYLSRGGEPVPLSPKLNDAPPAIPGA
jgi:Na+-transporting methylmalonyl-CoA/oxaloacetate decarboxylase beta subunit